MKIRLFVQITASLAVGIFFTFSAAGQSAGDWNAYKAANGIPSSWTYEYWQAHSGELSRPAAPAGPTPVQQMQLQGAQMLGTAIGNQIGEALFGSPQRVNPAQQAAQLAAQQEQQQRELAAQQLYNSGIYLLKQKPPDYLGAINEFQQALAQTPNDPDIIRNLALAKQKIKDTAVAAKNSGELSLLLGSQPPQPSISPARNNSPLNLVNVDANTVDLRNHPSTALNSLNVNYDTSAVDFRGLGKQNSTDEEKQNANLQALQRQLNQVFDPTIADSHTVNFRGLDKTQSANSSPQPAQDQQKLKDQLNNVLNANFDGQTHN